MKKFWKALGLTALAATLIPYYVDEDNDDDGVRVERTSDGDEFDLGISREGVAAATKDVNAIYKDGVAVAAELKGTFDEIADSLSFLKKKK